MKTKLTSNQLMALLSRYTLFSVEGNVLIVKPKSTRVIKEVMLAEMLRKAATLIGGPMTILGLSMLAYGLYAHVYMLAVFAAIPTTFGVLSLFNCNEFSVPKAWMESIHGTGYLERLEGRVNVAIHEAMVKLRTLGVPKQLLKM